MLGIVAVMAKLYITAITFVIVKYQNIFLTKYARFCLLGISQMVIATSMLEEVACQ
jgi:hypothetical protein